MAIVVLVILLVLIVVGISSCESAQREDALKTYTGNVASVTQDSNDTGHRFFALLTSGASPSSIATSIDQARQTAEGQLRRARGFAVPGSLAPAQDHLLLTLQMRRDAIATVGQHIQQALGGATRQDAINRIAAEAARLYASDVMYKDYTLPFVVGALRSDDIPVGGIDGQPIVSQQLVPDLRWLNPAFVGSQLHAGSQGRKAAPGVHGHALNSVAALGTTLQSGSTNSLAASPSPVFTLNFTNTGQNNESNVVCQVNMSGGGASGETTVSQTQAGKRGNCQVQMGSPPRPGSYTLTATIQPVPGEKNVANNTLTFPVRFH